MNDEMIWKNEVLTQEFTNDEMGFEELLVKVSALVWVRSPDFKIIYQNFYENLLDDEDTRLDQAVIRTLQNSTVVKKYTDSTAVPRWFYVKRIPFHTNSARLPSVLGFATEITEFYHSIDGCEKLLASVSHDLKNPISAVLISASAARRLLVAATGEQLKGQVEKVCWFLKSIEKSCHTVMGLICNVLDSTRSSSGEVPLRLEKNDVYEVIEDAIGLLNPLALRKSQTLFLGIEKQKIELVCDRVRLLQVFSNLIGNALNFTNEGGEVKIKMKRLKEEILFEVSDNGVGISREQLPFVFNRYWRGSCAQKVGGKNEGVGLGLAIAKKNVEAHNGKIWIESILGSGTQVFFTLPDSVVTML